MDGPLLQRQGSIDLRLRALYVLGDWVEQREKWKKKSDVSRHILAYLPTLKSDVIYGCSLIATAGDPSRLGA